jgi:hypothetical protein
MTEPPRPSNGFTSDRPQDAGRSHKRKGAPSAATRSLLTRYQDTMRAELAAVLDELAPAPPDPGLGMVPVAPKRPPIADRIKLWELGIKLGRELGSEIDSTPKAPAVVGPSRRRRARVDYG